MNRETASESWSSHWGKASELGLFCDRVGAQAYASPELFEIERERIFRKAWFPVARECEVASPDDFVRKDIHPLRTDALVVRGKDGELRAFHNACLHRGAQVVSECKGNASTFLCPYHAWNYGLDGQFKGAPGKEYFPHLKSGTIRLKPINLAVWNGFVFLNFEDEPQQTLAQFLGDFATLFDGMPFEDYPHVLELTWDIEANWKVLMEASNEAYHVGFLHKQTTGDQVTSADNPLNNVYDPVFSPPHATATVRANEGWMPDQPVLRFVYDTEAFRAQPGGVRSGDQNAAGPRLFTDHPGVNRIGLPAMATESILMFPFTCLQMMTDRYLWFQYWPVAVDRTLFVLRLYSRSAPTSYREAFAEAHMAAYTRDIATEDGSMTASQQRQLAGGGIAETVFGENECVLRFFHQMISDWLEEK